MQSVYTKYHKIFPFWAKALLLTFILFTLYGISEELDKYGNIILFLLLFAGVLGFFDWRRNRIFRMRTASKRFDFPSKWKIFLNTNVAFYRTLTDAEKKRFELDVHFFLMQKKISGIDVSITDYDRLLVASSAVIPVFGFPDWIYLSLKEVLLYAGTFHEEFKNYKREKFISSMIGVQDNKDVMILSLDDLRKGFKEESDKNNLGLHEFAHLIDKADGSIDGVPDLLLERKYTRPWLKLIHKEMQAINGSSDIDVFGAASEEEFFAVASEYFFEQPFSLKNNHPDLYKMLVKVYHQDLKTEFKSALLS